MVKGLFLNQVKAVCSIYESGLMISNILRNNKNFHLDYFETGKDFKTKDSYDFCVVNWHCYTLPINKETINKLPGFKVGINLEVLPNNSFPSTPNNLFDAYMVIDPTKKKEGKVYPFPRPLEVASDLPEIIDSIPVIGSFGLYGGGSDKRFSEIIDYFNESGEKCIVRINLPYATFIPNQHTALNEYENKLKKLARSNIDLRITHDHMIKEELIAWCAQHHINIFPYYRETSGLSAVTDQAITAGRAIGINDCPTFRHMHPYIPIYPKQSYKELMVSTLDGVRQMQIDWHPYRFNDKFTEMLEENKIL